MKKTKQFLDSLDINGLSDPNNEKNGQYECTELMSKRYQIELCYPLLDCTMRNQVWSLNIAVSLSLSNLQHLNSKESLMTGMGCTKERQPEYLHQR